MVATALRSPFDRRTAPRTSTHLEVKLSLRGFPEPLKARAVDIGPSGICVTTYSRLPIRDVTGISLVLAGEPISVQAEGRWQRLDNTGRGLVAGLMFHGVDTALASKLRTYVFESALGVATFLLESSALEDLDIDDAIDAALLTRSADYGLGRRIYEQGAFRTRGDSLFIVQQGTVVLEARVPGHGRRVVARIGAGGVFAGLPLVAEAPHTESAIAETDAALLEIDPFSFATLEHTRPRVGRQILRAVLKQRAATSRTLPATEPPRHPA